MNIDYSKIIANNYNLYVTEERLEEIKELAAKEKTIIFNKNHANNITSIFARKASEIAYTSSRYQMLSNAEKALIASNIVFDNEKFIYILNKGNFEINSLETFIKLINYIKYKHDNNKLTDNDQRYINTINTYTKKLVNHFSIYVGQVDPTIIINKLNEILSFNHDLLENKVKKYTR